ncbi:MAG: cell division protein FtsH, partial [Ignavibacteria bacterium]|nr:cell division protein FtsH [Ignavibacteria bacterium]
MDENKDNKNLKIPKSTGPNKPDDNFDWSKIIRMVFGWGAVIVAAVIVMQLLKTSSTNYVDIPYNQYVELLNNEKILRASITKVDINDYYFKGELKAEEMVKIGAKEVKVRNFSVYLPEP